jgi:hypothetical protein
VIVKAVLYPESPVPARAVDGWHAEIAQVRLASLQGRPTVQAEFKK